MAIGSSSPSTPSKSEQSVRKLERQPGVQTGQRTAPNDSQTSDILSSSGGIFGAGFAIKQAAKGIRQGGRSNSQKPSKERAGESKQQRNEPSSPKTQKSQKPQTFIPPAYDSFPTQNDFKNFPGIFGPVGF